ncbi:hypothetical protein HOO65_011168 [Ceratocystis lukuohia]|uniref:Uncharacterized protein n=2 Tax=Ceratocystis TaxID=5157 RepID=A0A0F8BKY6_CERFI|nr:hypothetical protein CFO_g4631 [Ceratocystis platani]
MSSRSTGPVRDTGFPEHFNGNGNTTLPYPGAHTGPNAILSSSDIDPSLFAVKARRSFQLSQMKRNLSLGRSRTTRYGRNNTSGFTIDSALVTAIGPSTAHVTTPSPSSSVASASSFAVSSLDQVRECEDAEEELHLRTVPTANTSIPSLPEDLAGTGVACQDLALSGTDTNTALGEDQRPLTSESRRSSFGNKSRRSFGRIFSRGRKNSN